MPSALAAISSHRIVLYQLPLESSPLGYASIRLKLGDEKIH